MSQSPTINGLDSPPPPSPFRIDATPPRPRPAGGAEQINLFFSPANSEAPSARGAAAGSYIRHKSPPQVYTRTARSRAYDDDEDEDEDEEEGNSRAGELPPPNPKRQRQRAAVTSSVAGRNRALPSAQNQASALALFDDLDPATATTSRNVNGNTGNRNGNGNGNETLFDPLMGPVGMMEDDTGGRAREGEEGKKRSMPKMDVERVASSRTLKHASAADPERDLAGKNRLLGDRGFPALIKDAKRFRIRGKGHEAKDLANLLSMYQLWAHQMYPKMTFGDTVTKVETLCGTNLAKSALRGYRERDREMKDALFREPTPPPAGSSTTVPFQDRGDADLMDDMRLPERTESISNAASADLGLTGVSPPAGELQEEEEEEDYEAMIAAAQAEAEDAQRQLASTTTRTGDRADDGDNDDDFPSISIDEQEMEMAMASAPVAGRANVTSVAQGGEDEYEDDWAAMDGM
ncbi:hypothetical protein QFC21_003648 [Naganishia friedmannii]|uniref:Uncharacterized protein n=1 Tax=Naganishia friedmannii TaxID=89922 RepID=A0ACC2VNN9_9TREE|nr:hypothetical protein QFC21_003648 [Naganishia friedmannii]